MATLQDPTTHAPRVARPPSDPAFRRLDSTIIAMEAAKPRSVPRLVHRARKALIELQVPAFYGRAGR